MSEINEEEVQNNSENKNIKQQPQVVPVIDHRLLAGKLTVYNWMEDTPEGCTPSEIVEVRFKNTRKGFYLNNSNLKLNIGDIVAVEAALGHDIGIVSLTGELVREQMRLKKVDLERNPLKKIYRKAKPHDIEKWQQAIALEHDTMIRSRVIAAELGLDMKIIDGKEVKEICPYLSDEIIGASWCPTDGHANPMLTTLAYYKRATELGVNFFTDAKVAALEKVKGKLRKVILESGEEFEADKVILAAGYESRFIARTVGIDVPMTKYFEEALVTEVQPHMFDIMLGVASADFYGHQSQHGSFVFGSDSGLEETTDMGLDELRTSPLTVSAGCRAIMGYIPMLADAKIVRTWGGWLDLCYDGVPVISEVDEVPGLILACGFTGHGFGTAPAVGLMLSQMVLGEKTVVDISSLRYDRFKAVR